VIYFLQSVNGGPIKIGCTTNLPVRVAQLEATYGQPLALLGSREGDRKTEAEIHAKFAHLRFGKTEQFRPAADLMSFIGKPLLVDPNPDAVEAMLTANKQNVLSVRGSEEWRAWVHRFCDHTRTHSASDLIDQALVEYARTRGFADPPPKR
jgi:hypothetical protein